MIYNFIFSAKDYFSGYNIYLKMKVSFILNTFLLNQFLMMTADAIIKFNILFNIDLFFNQSSGRSTAAL